MNKPPASYATPPLTGGVGRTDRSGSRALAGNQHGAALRALCDHLPLGGEDK